MAEENKAGESAPAPAAAAAQRRQITVTERQTDQIMSQYSNVARVTGTPEEIVLEFGNRPVEQWEATEFKIDTRVVMNPFAAKRLLGAMMQTVNNYEQRFGKIELDLRQRMTRT